MKKIFIGGFGGSGSRVLQNILENCNYNIGEPFNNYVYDYIAKNADKFIQAFDNYYIHNQSPEDLINQIKLYTNNKDYYSLKHGHFMFIYNELREWFGANTIYIMRNPIDNAINGYNTHLKYGNQTSTDIIKIINWYIDETEKGMTNADYIVKLEDLCFNTEETITNFLNFAGVEDYDMNKLKKLIKVPESIGRGKEYYNQFDLKKIGY